MVLYYRWVRVLQMEELLLPRFTYGIHVRGLVRPVTSWVGPEGHL